MTVSGEGNERNPEAEIKKRKDTAEQTRKETTMKKNTGYEINPIDKTITLTKKFLKGASTMGTPEYKELKKLEKDNPGFELKVREITPCETKVTYNELTFKVMETIIRGSANGNKEEETKKIAEFEAIKVFYEGNKTTKYGHVKSWFVGKYKDEYIAKYGNKTQKKVA